MKTSFKDFIFHLSKIILLYIGVIAILNLIFVIINKAFPQITYSYYSQSSISFQVATLIIVFPIFLIISKLINKEYVADPSKKDSGVRKGLMYITLFIASAILTGTLISLLYYFLDGRELTSGFLLKVLTIIIVIGSVFGYFLDDLKNKLTDSRRKLWKTIAVILVLGSIILGFSVVGSPANQRKARFDEQRISDLQNIQWQVTSYWQKNNVLPQTLTDLQDQMFGSLSPVDPETKKPYVYEVVTGTSFKLCADFKSAQDTDAQNGMGYAKPLQGMNNWNHDKGYYCFDRTIDPAIYPPYVR